MGRLSSSIKDIEMMIALSNTIKGLLMGWAVSITPQPLAVPLPYTRTHRYNCHVSHGHITPQPLAVPLPYTRTHQ